MWYYVKENNQVGPVDQSVLENLLQTGALSPDVLVWRDGMPDWIPAARCEELATASTDQSSTPPDLRAP